MLPARCCVLVMMYKDVTVERAHGGEEKQEYHRRPLTLSMIYVGHVMCYPGKGCLYIYISYHYVYFEVVFGKSTVRP